MIKDDAFLFCDCRHKDGEGGQVPTATLTQQHWVCSLSSVTGKARLAECLAGARSPGDVQRRTVWAHRRESGLQAARCHPSWQRLQDRAGSGRTRRPGPCHVESHARPGLRFRDHFGPWSPGLGRWRRWRLLWLVEAAFGVLRCAMFVFENIAFFCYEFCCVWLDLLSHLYEFLGLMNLDSWSWAYFKI